MDPLDAVIEVHGGIVIDRRQRRNAYLGSQFSGIMSADAVADGRQQRCDAHRPEAALGFRHADFVYQQGVLVFQAVGSFIGIAINKIIHRQASFGLKQDHGLSAAGPAAPVTVILLSVKTFIKIL